MCYNKEMTGIVALLATVRMAHILKNPSKSGQLYYYVFFYMMEVLQLLGYFYPESDMISRTLFVHVAFQPLVMLSHILAEERFRLFRRPLLGAASVSGVLYSLRSVSSIGIDPNAVFSTRGNAQCILPPASTHITWTVPLGTNLFEYFTPNVYTHFAFFILIPFFLAPQRILATFLCGPVLSAAIDTLITGRFRYGDNLAEASMAATWCLQTVLILLFT
jgi:hypothetical protein